MEDKINSTQDVEDLDDIEIVQSNKLSIDWLGMTQKLLSIRKQIFVSAIVGILVGITVAFTTPKRYTVGVTLSPEMSHMSKSGNSFVGMAASILGAGFKQNSPDAINALLAPNIVSSTPFMLNLLDSRVVSQDGKIDTTFSAYLEEESGSLLSCIKQIPSTMVGLLRSLIKKEVEISDHEKGQETLVRLTFKDSRKLKKLRNCIEAAVDKSAITTIRVTLQDPKVAAIIADSVVTKLQNTIIQYRISKAQEDTQYWEKINRERQNDYLKAQKVYADYVDSNSYVVSQRTLAEKERLSNEMNFAYQVYVQVAQQLQMARAKIQEDKPAFTIIEPPVIPLYPSSTSRIVILMVCVILFVAVSIFWFLYGKSYFHDFKMKFWNQLNFR